MKYLALALLCIVACASATVFFKEEFDSGWEKRWVSSKFKEAEGTAGKFVTSAGKYSADEKDKGLQTSQDYKFYQISTKFPKFSNKGKTLYFEYTVKHEQSIDCGGGYVKLLPANFDQENFNGDTKYYLMFGPDICGFSNKKTHLIFNYKDQNHLLQKEVKCKDDDLTHLYSVVISSDNSYELLIDGESQQKGSLPEHWNFLPPKEIKDPNVKKPADWVEDAEIPDPEAKKPAGWDDIPQYIPDPDAKKPEDWDEEADGTWEAPTVENPAYKGEWKAPMIKNAAYKGPWVHPMIANPEFKDDPNIYAYNDIGGLGIEIWQVKSGTIFDHFLVTDDEAAYKKHQKDVLALISAEKAAAEKGKEEERKVKEAAEAAKKEAEKKEDKDDEDDEDDEDEKKTEKKSKDEL